MSTPQKNKFTTLWNHHIKSCSIYADTYEWEFRSDVRGWVLQHHIVRNPQDFWKSSFLSIFQHLWLQKKSTWIGSDVLWEMMQRENLWVKAVQLGLNNCRRLHDGSSLSCCRVDKDVLGLRSKLSIPRLILVNLDNLQQISYSHKITWYTRKKRVWLAYRSLYQVFTLSHWDALYNILASLRLTISGRRFPNYNFAYDNNTQNIEEILHEWIALGDLKNILFWYVKLIELKTCTVYERHFIVRNPVPL